ncbi:MAG: DUF4175 family protein [Methylocystaceae bacterium]|nr:DUF4175 family protein [Methylocystaceae bacterium]
MQELDNAALRRVHRMIYIVRAILFWERLWPRLWPFLVLSSLFIIAILFNIFSLLPAAMHILVLGVAAIGGVVSFAYGFVGLPYPTKVEALHKLERDSGFENQPLFALLDHPAGQSKDKFSETIWLNHQDRMVSLLPDVRLCFPRSRLYKKDPYSLRALLIILIILGVIEARFDYKDRIFAAFAPASHVGAVQNWKLEAWINPPAYTGLGPIFLSVDQDSPDVTQPISILQHSELLLRLEGHGAREQYSLSTGVFVEKLQKMGQGIHSLETTIEQAYELQIMRANQQVYRWPIDLIIDEPPKISINGKPRSGFRGHLTIGYRARDDFGLKQVQLIIRPLTPDGRPDIVLSENVSEREAKARFRRNLSDHPWAGQDVVMTPVAVDSAGQTARGHAVQFRLPERQFTHPVAMRLIAIRKKLAENEPDVRFDSVQWLDTILDVPADFNDDVAIYLALNVARDRLLNERTDLAPIRAILWETAVRLEEGVSGSARNQLEFMSRQMQQMMHNPEDKAAMEALFEQMQQSLDQYLQKMSQSMPDLSGFEEALSAQNADMIGRDELMELLNKARELMRTGNIEAAQAVMEQFQSILSRLAMQKKPDAQQMKAANEVMKKLQKLQEDQKDLLDQTFRRSRNPDRPSLNSTRQAIEEAEMQENLLKALQNQMQQLQKMGAKTPDALRMAEQEMARAAHSLQRGLDEVAVQAQSRALDHLRQGLKDSAQTLAQKMGMQSLPQQLPGYDPLGRRSGKGYLSGETGDTVPTNAEMKQSREILQELYRRAGQKGRAEQELKYIERLLERF